MARSGSIALPVALLVAALYGLAAGVPTFSQVKWEQVNVGTSRPLGRIPAASAACNGKLFVFGGETDVKSSDPTVVNRYLNDLWVFSPPGGQGSLPGGQGSWEQLSVHGLSGSPDARVASSMVCASGTLTIFGGIRKDKQDFVKLADVWSFNIARNRWTQIQKDSAAAGGPGPLSSHTATLTDLDQDSMVVFGGNDADSANVNKLWVYSLSRMEWVLKQPPHSPECRDFHTAVAIPNSTTFKIWGGIVDVNVWVYDVKSNTWSASGPAPSYRSGRSGAILDDKLFSFGGLEIGGTVDYSNEMLWRASDVNEMLWSGSSWEAVKTDGNVLPAGRCYATVAAIHGSIWMYGGYHRPASVERLPDLWKMSLEDSDVIV